MASDDQLPASLGSPASTDAPSESFRVFARLRPPRNDSGSALLRVVKRHGLQRTVQGKNLEFLLDWVWDSDGEQADVYERGVSERVSWVLQGYNATILAYGQTGSGKTHTSA